MKKQYNILFVCRHNRFRSKFAETYFKKINNNKRIKVKSAGIFPGSYPLDKLEIKISKKLGSKISGKPKPVTTKLMEWKNLIVLITNDIKNPDNLFNYGKYQNKFINWKISDNKNNSEKEIEKILKTIMKKVENLNKKLEKQNGNSKRI